MNTIKQSYSLRRCTFEKLERIRKRRGLKSKSAIMQEAAEFWLKAKEKEALEKQYEQGYVREPEHVADLESYYKAGSTSFTPEDW